MVQKDLILDFNLYLCEKFGYRESCSVMSHANGFCVDIRERDLDCYIRFWEYSCGRGNFPDWSFRLSSWFFLKLLRTMMIDQSGKLPLPQLYSQKRI